MTKVISRFDQLGTVWLRATQQCRTEVARLSNSLSLPHHQLYEVWLTPETEPALSSSFLEKACYNNAGELMDFDSPENPALRLRNTAKEHLLLDAFASNLAHVDAHFNYSVQDSDFGEVISVVFGSKPAMEIMYQRRLRVVPVV